MLASKFRLLYASGRVCFYGSKMIAPAFVLVRK
jgi:hypothetical protein